MRTNIVLAAASLFLVTGAVAQDTPASLQIPGNLVEMAASDANSYVLFVQRFLADRGEYAGPVDGLLTQQTIGSLNAFCRSSGIGDVCARGPLLPEAIAAVQSAIGTALGSPVTAAAQPPAATPGATAVQPLVAANESLSLPEGWTLKESGGPGATGIEARVVSAGPNEATIHFVGTATRQGYINVLTGEDEPSGQGTWVAELSGRQERPSSSAEGAVYLRTAMFQETAYVGELFAGVPLSDAGDEQRVSGSGQPKPEATRLTPYVQLPVEAGQQVDLVVHLTDPSFGMAL